MEGREHVLAIDLRPGDMIIMGSLRNPHTLVVACSDGTCDAEADDTLIVSLTLFDDLGLWQRDVWANDIVTRIR